MFVVGETGLLPTRFFDLSSGQVDDLFSFIPPSLPPWQQADRLTETFVVCLHSNFFEKIRTLVSRMILLAPSQPCQTASWCDTCDPMNRMLGSWSHVSERGQSWNAACAPTQNSFQ